jgi:hypothetical protein
MRLFELDANGKFLIEICFFLRVRVWRCNYRQCLTSLINSFLDFRDIAGRHILDGDILVMD